MLSKPLKCVDSAVHRVLEQVPPNTLRGSCIYLEHWPCFAIADLGPSFLVGNRQHTVQIHHQCLLLFPSSIWQSLLDFCFAQGPSHQSQWCPEAQQSPKRTYGYALHGQAVTEGYQSKPRLQPWSGILWGWLAWTCRSGCTPYNPTVPWTWGPAPSFSAQMPLPACPTGCSLSLALSFICGSARRRHNKNGLPVLEK